MCGVLTVGSVLMTGAVSEDENHKDNVHINGLSKVQRDV